ncbi:peroxiredoxin [candidate division TA06 bacterium DG_26]|uniref:Peroxiredoxin n=1 Tax=candidate division TA06 bacterium DG_26 TaxID=1703771 RepID=A0A0S7WID6_UNCT6|nr:MAG: peroxiredoxin [candidate division TA06 bacterium DG_26]
MAKVAITCNGAQPPNVFPPFILGSAAAASGDEVVIFFTPGGAPAMVKGVIEKMEGKGLPNLLELFEGLRSLGGKILVCELALEAKDLKKDDFREGVEIVGATSFMNDIKDAQITFSF